jgi:hypothetical protein
VLRRRDVSPVSPLCDKAAVPARAEAPSKLPPGPAASPVWGVTSQTSSKVGAGGLAETPAVVSALRAATQRSPDDVAREQPSLTRGSGPEDKKGNGDRIPDTGGRPPTLAALTRWRCPSGVASPCLNKLAVVVLAAPEALSRSLRGRGRAAVARRGWRRSGRGHDTGGLTSASRPQRSESLEAAQRVVARLTSPPLWPRSTARSIASCAPARPIP